MPVIDNSDNEVGNLSSPELVDSNYSLHAQREKLIYIVLMPYVGFAAIVLFMVLFSGLAQERIMLGASVVLAPLGALAGGIIGYYFKSSS